MRMHVSIEIPEGSRQTRMQRISQIKQHGPAALKGVRQQESALRHLQLGMVWRPARSGHSYGGDSLTVREEVSPRPEQRGSLCPSPRRPRPRRKDRDDFAQPQSSEQKRTAISNKAFRIDAHCFHPNASCQQPLDRPALAVSPALAIPSMVAHRFAPVSMANKNSQSKANSNGHRPRNGSRAARLKRDLDVQTVRVGNGQPSAD